MRPWCWWDQSSQATGIIWYYSTIAKIMNIIPTAGPGTSMNLPSRSQFFWTEKLVFTWENQNWGTVDGTVYWKLPILRVKKRSLENTGTPEQPILIQPLALELRTQLAGNSWKIDEQPTPNQKPLAPLGDPLQIAPWNSLVKPLPWLRCASMIAPVNGDGQSTSMQAHCMFWNDLEKGISWSC